MLDWSGAVAAAVAALEDEDAEELSFLGVGLSPPPPLASPLVMAVAAATEDLLPFGVLLPAEIFLTEDDFFLGVTRESFLPRGVLGAAAAALSRGVEGALPVWPSALWLEEEEEASLMLLPTPLEAANGGGGGAAAAAAEEAGAGGATSAIVVPRTQDYAWKKNE